MMLALGLFTFSLDTLAPQSLDRKSDWKHARQPRVGALDASQFLGEGSDTISLKGWLAPEFAGDPDSLDQLRDMADSGQAWPLVDGTGRVYGAFVIDGIDEGQTLFWPNGRPRRIDFGIDLHRVAN